MANAELEMLLKARDEASSILNKVKGALGDVSKIAAGFVIGQGLAKLPGFLFNAAQGAANDEASIKRVQVAYERADGVMSQFNEMLSRRVSMGQRLAFSDDQIRDSLTNLFNATGKVRESQTRLSMAQDIARGTGMDLVTVSRLLGRVNEESINVFKRYGIAVKEGATEQEALAAIHGRFAGQSAAFATTKAGLYEIAKLRMVEAKETIGAALLPAMTKLLNFTSTEMLPAIEKFAAAVGPKLAEAWAKAKPIIDDAITGIKTKVIPFLRDEVPPLWAKFSAAAKKEFENFKRYWQSDLKPAIDNIITAVKAVIEFVQRNWPTIKLVVMPIIEEIKNHVERNIRIVMGVLGILIDLIQGDFSGAWKRAKQLVADVWDSMKQSANNFVNFLRGLGTVFLEIGKHLAGQLAQGLKDALKSIDIKVGGVNLNPFRAHGGPVTAGRSYIVGERGPELYTPGASGFITPNESLRGGGGVTINVTLAGPVYGYDDFRQKVTQAIRDAVLGGGFRGVPVGSV